jgi:hypothetical protein
MKQTTMTWMQHYGFLFHGVYFLTTQSGHSIEESPLMSLDYAKEMRRRLEAEYPHKEIVSRLSRIFNANAPLSEVPHQCTLYGDIETKAAGLFTDAFRKGFMVRLPFGQTDPRYMLDNRIHFCGTAFCNAQALCVLELDADGVRQFHHLHTRWLLPPSTYHGVPPTSTYSETMETMPPLEREERMFYGRQPESVLQRKERGSRSRKVQDVLIQRFTADATCRERAMDCLRLEAIAALRETDKRYVAVLADYAETCLVAPFDVSSNAAYVRLLRDWAMKEEFDNLSGDCYASLQERLVLAV